MSRGVFYAFAAYFLWGVFPIYFKQVQAVAPLEVLGHRVVWSLVFVLALLTALRRWHWLRGLLDQPQRFTWFALSAVAVSINWLIFIWSVNTGHIVDASLGYFINPLLNVLIGSMLLNERLRPAQWAAVLLAALAVAWLTWTAGRLPWIALALAGTFAAYGFLRKRAPLGALEGLAVETALLAPLAVGYLVWIASHQQSAFISAVDGGAYGLVGWLLLAGPVTAVPLLLFTAGARRISFATLGLLQYVGPSLQLLIGVHLYGEPFDANKVAAYGVIWIALAIFSIDGLVQWRLAGTAKATARSAGAD